MQSIENLLAEFALSDPAGRISQDLALREDLAGLRLFDAPIVRVGDATDPLFARFRDPTAVGPLMRSPSDWLADAKCVVSYFFPMSERVRVSNRTGRFASDEWFHARIQGQAFIVAAGKRLCEHLRARGFQAVCPVADLISRRISLKRAIPAVLFAAIGPSAMSPMRAGSARLRSRRALSRNAARPAASEAS